MKGLQQELMKMSAWAMMLAMGSQDDASLTFCNSTRAAAVCSPLPVPAHDPLSDTVELFSDTA